MECNCILVHENQVDDNLLVIKNKATKYTHESVVQV